MAQATNRHLVEGIKHLAKIMVYVLQSACVCVLVRVRQYEAG